MTNLPPLGPVPIQPEASVSPVAATMPLLVPQPAPLKERHPAWVAALHWAFGYFLLPLVGGTLAGLIVFPVVMVLLLGSQAVSLVIVSAVALSLFWLGATVSGRYVAGHYAVDPAKVALLASGYALAIGVLLGALEALREGFTTRSILVDVIGLSASVAVFYFTSRVSLRRPAEDPSSSLAAVPVSALPVPASRTAVYTIVNLALAVAMFGLGAAFFLTGFCMMGGGRPSATCQASTMLGTSFGALSALFGFRLIVDAFRPRLSSRSKKIAFLASLGALAAIHLAFWIESSARRELLLTLPVQGG